MNRLAGLAERKTTNRLEGLREWYAMDLTGTGEPDLEFPHIQTERPFDPAEHPIAGETFRAGAVERGAIAAFRATGIPKLLPTEEAGLAGGAAVPSPQELKKMAWYKKFPEYTGWLGMEVTELAAAHGVLKGLGVLGQLPKHPSIFHRAAATARWWGGTEAMRQAGQRIGEAIAPAEYEYKPQNIFLSATFGYALSLGLSGAGGLIKKLATPGEKKLALRALGLKKKATEQEIKEAVVRLGERVRAGEVSKKDQKLIQRLYERWLKKQPDIVYRGTKPKTATEASRQIARVPLEAEVEARQAAEISQMDAEVAELGRLARVERLKKPTPTVPTTKTSDIGELAKKPAVEGEKGAAEQLKNIAYDLGEYYGRIPANATNKKAADRVLDAMVEIQKGNNEEALELLDKAMKSTIGGFHRVQAKAGGRGAGPVQEKQATSDQRTADQIYRIAQGLKKDMAPAPIAISKNNVQAIGSQMARSLDVDENIRFVWDEGDVSVRENAAETTGPDEEGVYTVTVKSKHPVFYKGYYEVAPAEIEISPENIDQEVLRGIVKHEIGEVAVSEEKIEHGPEFQKWLYGEKPAPAKPAPAVEGKVAGMAYLLDDGTILKDMGAASHISLAQKVPAGKKVVDAGFLDKDGNYLMRDDVIEKGKTYSYVEPDGTVVQAKIIEDDVRPEMLTDGIVIEIPAGKFNIEREQLLKPIEEQFADRLEQWESRKSLSKHPMIQEEFTEPKPVLRPLEPTLKQRKIVLSLRKSADSLSKQIEQKRHPAIADQAVTRRRANIAAGMAKEADYLERQQETLRAIADAIEKGTLPATLENVKSRTDVEAILRGYFSLPDMHKTHYYELLEKTKGAKGSRELKENLRGMVVGENRATFSTDTQVQAIEKLIKLAENRGVNTRWMKGGIAEGKRFIRLGIKNKTELEQAKGDLEGLLKPKPKEPPKEIQIREKTHALIGRKIPGFFPTPKPVIETMLEKADIESGMSVLEPSAGKGDIADTIKEQHPDSPLKAIEYNSELAEILKLKGHDAEMGDFLEHQGQYDRIVMNPPFEKGQDIEHIQHAYKQLKAGGKLVSVISESPFFRTEKKYSDFRDWLDSVGGTSEKIEGKFKGKEAFRQTDVNFRILTIKKPTAPAKPAAKVEKEVKPHEVTKEEAIIEPVTSLEMGQQKAGEPVSETEPTGQLDPTNYEDALEIINLHKKFLAPYGYGRSATRGPWKGIYTTKWDEKTRKHVIDNVEYTSEEIDTAYRTIQKPVSSPMPDAKLFAMPGKESEVEAVGKKMTRLSKLPRKTAKKPGLTKPKSLPKAKTTKEDSIKAVWQASSSESERYAIAGVLVEGDTIVATDGRRMFWAKGKWGKDGIYMNVASLKKGLLGKPDKKGVKFPSWRDVVPDVSGEQPILVSELPAVWHHVRQAASMTTEESRGIVIIANKDGSLGFAGASPEVGHAEINVQPGGRILGAVNPDYFLDALAYHATRGDASFEFYFPDWQRPILTRNLDGKTFTLTMPINVGTEGPMSEAIARAIAEGKPGEHLPKKKGMRAGFADVEAVAEIPKAFMRVLEPSKAVERKLGKEAYAAVIKGIHATDEARVRFEQTELPKKDKVINELEEWLDKFPDKDLDNLMLSRGDPVSVNAQLVKRDAIKKLPKELRSEKLLKAIQHIADVNYKYLQSVVGDDVNKVADYFYGTYKNRKMVDKFLDYWRTTKRFTKEKKLPTYADAKDYGLQIKDPNPVRNLKAEYVAIAHLEGMNWLKDELLRTGKGKFINDVIQAPVEWDKVNDPAFSDLRLQPDLAKLVNNLISANKISQVPALNALRHVNNFLRTIKFIGSGFHLLSVAKQSIADSGYLGFYKKTATRGFTTGFRKNDPLFKTPQYRDYIKHGGGHRYSIESEAQRGLHSLIKKLNKEFGIAFKYGALPVRVPVGFVNWMFRNYIPKVKYAKYLDTVAEKEKKLGRRLTSPEKTDIIKEQQNFYGMMNERLFGRSGTWTTVLRFFWMSPGYAEGNFRSITKGGTQWGGKKGFRAGRSRSNIINSFLLSAGLATIGTAILTGKWPKKLEAKEDFRDLFKIDTGKTDDKGRRIMIDLLTYDKDYWNVYGNLAIGEWGKIPETTFERIGGMKATTGEVAVDLALIAQGRGIYDWKGDKVTEITDPFLRKVMKLAVHEIRKTEPISWSVFKQSKRKNIDTTIAAVETLLGFRPTTSEKDKREQAITNRIYSLKGQQEKLYQYLGTLRKPRAAIRRYNNTVNTILESKMVPKSMREEWKPKLLVDLDRLLANKAYYLTSPRRTPEEIVRATKYLKNFGIGPEQAQQYLNKYWARERKKTPVSPLERDRVIGRARKRRRLRERMAQ